MRWTLPALSFADPASLYFLIPAGVLIAAGLFLKWCLSRAFDRFFEGEHLFLANLSGPRTWAKAALLSCAFCAIVLASAGPSVKTQFRSYNFMALVDISQSMWCQDYRENGVARSRLDMAKSNLISLVDELPAESRFGLGIFAGKRHSVLILAPPQDVGNSRSDLKAMIGSIEYGWTWDDGTNVQDALLVVANILEEKHAEYGQGLTLIFLTDGEDALGYITRREPLNPGKFAGAHLYFAGYGTPEGALVPEFDEKWKPKGYREDSPGSPIRSRLDEISLTTLANLLQGSYKRIEGSSDLKLLARNQTFKAGQYETEVNLSWALWLTSFLLLLLFLVA